MPKAVTQYCCELCGKIFDNEIFASICEKNHKEPVSVEKPLYNESELRYPSSVLVKFKDGDSARYVLR